MRATVIEVLNRTTYARPAPKDYVLRRPAAACHEERDDPDHTVIGLGRRSRWRCGRNGDVFSLPGIGTLLTQSIWEGTSLPYRASSSSYRWGRACQPLADLAYAWLDPRIRQHMDDLLINDRISAASHHFEPIWKADTVPLPPCGSRCQSATHDRCTGARYLDLLASHCRGDCSIRSARQMQPRYFRLRKCTIASEPTCSAETPSREYSLGLGFRLLSASQPLSLALSLGSLSG